MNININIKATRIILFLLLLSSTYSCKKSWLDEKRNKSDIEPKTLKDFQQVLDNTSVINVSPGFSAVGTDNLYFQDNDWANIFTVEQNMYIWAPDIFQGQSCLDWNACYKIIECSNIVLDGLGKIDVNSSNQVDYNTVKGEALFFRAKTLAELSSLFAKSFDPNTAASDLGVPIRLSSDVNDKSIRSTVKQTFDQILSDLKTAEQLLPINAQYQTRPSKTAADALMAKVYLNMGDYANAGQYANTALSSYNTLLDFNNVPVASFAFPNYPNNKEIIFWSSSIQNYSLLGAWSYVNVDSNLYKSYDNNDLRKSLFYEVNVPKISFVGSYTGSLATPFSGLATNELYLIRAECSARNGNVSSAMSDLNALIQKRWKKTVVYPTITATDANDALKKILVERRKEMPFTEFSRWDDLRRLNKDPQFAKTLTRKISGTTYTLQPNDNRYVYPIPPDEIKLSGVQQNPR